MRYRLLGQLEVIGDDGRGVAFGGEKERIVLSALLLGANRVVPTGRLIDALWGERPPQRAGNALQVQVSRLRKKLAAAAPGRELLGSEPSGYRLTVGRGELDVTCFEDLVGLTGGPPAEMSSTLTEALALWRGPALADVACEALRGEAVRLDELRWAVLERRIDADLALGRHQMLVAELEALAAGAPLREGFAGQLMLALYRAGRQADALAVYGRTREVLADQLGIDPSPGLQALELAVLNQSPDLDVPPAMAGPGGSVRVLPEGLVTLVFTDIEGSTNLLTENGDVYGEILADHHLLLRHCWQHHLGVEVGTEGDAFFVVFASPRAALAAVSAAQRALSAHPWPHGCPVRVRMGVHSGEVQVRDGEYWGIDVHYAARLCAAAHGGQVLVSAATRGLVTDLDVDDLGEHALKDFPVARRLFHLVIDGQRSDAFPPPRALSRSRTNLPSVVTPLVGREVELADLTRRLTESDSRLVTVTGSGGSGKTKLAIAAAGDLVERFPDGVFLVALAPVAGPSGVVPALVDSVAANVRLQGEEGLFEYLGDKEVLVVIDNFEHVLEAAPLIGRLLERAPKVRVLSTSQAPLRLAAETIVPLAPLAVPGPGESDLNRLGSVAAVALFVERAQACDPSFSLTPSNASSVAELCRSLGGLPLALELAAARVRLVGVTGLLEALNRGIEFLGRGSRDLPVRQRGLRAALDYTVSLLDDPCRRLLLGLGAFADAWTIEDAERVFGAEIDLWEAMATLLDLSLIRTRGDGRLTMAERVKTHARELLARSGREAEVRGRHAALMAEIAETIDVGYWFDSTALVVRTRENLEELEYAITWSGLHRPDLFRRLVGGCARTFWVIGRLDPLVGDIDRLSEQEDGSDITSGCILLARGVVERMRADNSVALPWVVRGVDCHRRTAEVPRLLASMAPYQVVLWHLGDTPALRASLDEAFALVGGQVDHRFHDFLEGVLVQVALCEGEFEAAERLLQQTLRHPERTDFTSSYALVAFADCAFGLRHGQVALERYANALEKCVADHDVVNSLVLLAGMAGSLALLRRDDEATQLAAATERLGRDLNVLPGLDGGTLVDAELAVLKERIGTEAWTQYGQAASGLTFDDLIAKARSVPKVKISH